MKNILVVDDDKLILFGLSRAFERRGFAVTTAGTVGQGAFLLESLSCDLCLLDIHLPDANGLDLMETILRKCPGLPIVMMSGGALAELDQRRLGEALDAGRCSFVAKPFSLHEMLELAVTAMQNEPEMESPWLEPCQEQSQGVLGRRSLEALQLYLGDRRAQKENQVSPWLFPPICAKEV